MPELPEVEITARLLDRALEGAQIESALAPGINALKTFDPPLSVLAGQKVAGVGRRGKQFVVKIEGPTEPLVLLIHLMSAGRLQLYDKRAGPVIVRRGCSCGSTTDVSCACASSAPSRQPG